MNLVKLELTDFRQFKGQEIVIGNHLTAIAGMNGTGKSTILGLLANSSQLMKFKTYAEKSFKADFAELFAGDAKFDKSGQTALLIYHDDGERRECKFRTAWQNGNKRFRVIPNRKKPDGRRSEAKLELPVIYLGLSRLYPVGEAKSEEFSAKKLRWREEKDEEWFVDNYKHILNIEDNLTSVGRLGLSNVSSKAGVGVATQDYGPATNSSGQDNLGQILLAILSLRNLKKKRNDSWNGGLLIIDEIDATLHPAAKLKLLDLLQDESKRNGFQTIFTTHSADMLKSLSEKNQHNNSDEPGNIEVAYLTNANDRLVVKRNPTWQTIRNDLYIKAAAPSEVEKIPVFTEDNEAVWLATNIIKEIQPELLKHLSFLDVSIGKDELMKLYKNDFEYIKDHIVLFDGDVTKAELKRTIQPDKMKEGGNIITLPMPRLSPEKSLWEYLKNLSNEEFWGPCENAGYTKRYIVEHGPESRDFSEYDSIRLKYKEWFKVNKKYFEDFELVKFWVEDNPDVGSQFIEGFIESYNTIASRTGIQEITRPNKPENCRI